MRILVIEDDPTVGQYVKRGLEEHRWAVDLTADGEEGERRASSEAYDLVVLDMRLPGKSGIEVLHSLRAKGFERPVLVLTAQDAVDAKVTALRAGERIELTPKEYTVLEYLARHAGRVMSRTLITEYAWGYHFDPGTNIVDVVINRLRKKIDQGKEARLIHTIRGVGYVLRP
ncbi:MAG TPA: response regulator transcription factor [Gemmatimonadaceae bacterium]|nr:response regulator transcription factor [Gemmatimonadaceae bacterium]